MRTRLLPLPLSLLLACDTPSTDAPVPTAAPESPPEASEVPTDAPQPAAPPPSCLPVMVGGVEVQDGDSLTVTAYSPAQVEVPSDCPQVLTWQHEGADALERSATERWLRWTTAGASTVSLQSADGEVDITLAIEVVSLEVEQAVVTCEDGSLGTTITLHNTWYGGTYGLWTSTDLSRWLPYSVDIPGEQGETAVTLCGLGSRTFFQTSIEGDADGDGLGTSTELDRLGTDDMNIDTDGDGIQDGLEDPDGDGMLNLRELREDCRGALSLPTLADTDGDGVTDMNDAFPQDSQRSASETCTDFSTFLGVWADEGTTITLDDEGTVVEFGYSSVVTLADHNGDGIDDVVVSMEQNGTMGVYVLYGPVQEDDTLQSGEFLSTGTAVSRGIGAYTLYNQMIDAIDLDGDEAEEILLSSQSEHVWLFEDGALEATFRDIRSDETKFVPDINGDGRPEVALLRTKVTTVPSVFIYFTPPSGFSGTYTAADADITITGAALRLDLNSNMAVGDFDGDGQSDLAVSADSNTNINNGDTIAIFYDVHGTTAATVDDADVLITGAYTKHGWMGAGDLDGDGVDDLIHSASFGNLVQVISGAFFHNGPLADHLTAEVRAENGAFWGMHVWVGDANRDGQVDLFVSKAANATWVGQDSAEDASEYPRIQFNDAGIHAFYGPLDLTAYGSRSVTDYQHTDANAMVRTKQTHDFDLGDVDGDGELDLFYSAYGSTGTVYRIFDWSP